MVFIQILSILLLYIVHLHTSVHTLYNHCRGHLSYTDVLRHSSRWRCHEYFIANFVLRSSYLSAKLINCCYLSLQWLIKRLQPKIRNKKNIYFCLRILLQIQFYGAVIKKENGTVVTTLFCNGWELNRDKENTY